MLVCDKKLLFKAMVDTISLFKDAFKHNAIHYNSLSLPLSLSLYLFPKMRVVVCQDTRKMQEEVEKNLDFLVCFCDVIYPSPEKTKHHSWEFCKMVLPLLTL